MAELGLKQLAKQDPDYFPVPFGDLQSYLHVHEFRGKDFVVGEATVAAAYSPRARPGVPVSFPVPWDELDRVTPADFTVHTAPRLLADSAPWAGQMPAPQSLGADLIEEGRAIPIARVQAMHEGKRRARARRRAQPVGQRPFTFNARQSRPPRLAAIESSGG